MQKVLLVTVLIINILVDKSFGCGAINKFADSIMTTQNSILVASKKFWESQANSGDCIDSQAICDYFYTNYRAHVDGLEPVFRAGMTVFKTEKYAIFLVDNPVKKDQ